MKHFASPEFWTCLEQLPVSVQELARQNYELLKTNPYHPFLHFKRISRFWSVRVGRRIERSQSMPKMASYGSGSAHTRNMTAWWAERDWGAVAEHGAAADALARAAEL